MLHVRRLILFLCCMIGAVAESSAAPAQYAFRVTFRDKLGAPPLSANPLWLSARSLARRSNFGIVLDSTDRPVSPLYVDSVLRLTQGVLHNTSRWLNQCVVLLTDSSKILQLNGKGFIGSIAWVGYFDQGLHLRVAKAGNPKFLTEQTGLSSAKVTGSSTYYGASWAQTTMVNGDYLHDLGFKGQGKLIAILDDGFTGVDTHTGFDSLRQNGRILETYNFKRDNSSVYSSDGSHGTACLSTMAGLHPDTYVGTAPNAQYALYVTEDGSITDALYELDNLIAGMERADSIGADVISASIVYNIFYSPFNFSFAKADFDGHTTNVARAVNMAVAKGIFYTSSAGNEDGLGWDFLDTPGDADSALTTGAVTGSRGPWNLSSPGPNSSGRIKPDVCLLGDQAAIFGSGNSVTYSSGTSFAAPQAAGYAACLLQAYPRATPFQVRQAIVRSADRYTAPTPKLGYGIPDFKKVYQNLSVDSPTGNAQVIVLPNPFAQSITVRLPAGAVTADISLLDVIGRSIAFNTQRVASTVTISLASSLPQGMYMMRIVVDGKSYVAKLTHL